MPESTEARSWLLIPLIAGAVLLRLYLFLDLGYSADDALITFRYADHLAAGNGFVYNEGEHVLGTTTPIFTLCLAALRIVHVSPFAGALLLNLAAECVIAMIFWSLFSTTSPGVRWIPVALYLISPDALQWSLSGMETEFSIACILAGFYFAARDSWKAAFAWGAFATLVRIDGAAVLIALTAAYVVRRGRLPLVPWAVAAAVLLPWTLFAFWYFGSPIPNSAAAKLALSGANWLAAAANILLKGFLHLHTFGIPVLILALVGTRNIAQKRNEWLPLAIWTWGYALSYAIAAGPMHPWYYAPFYAGYLALVWTGCLALAEHFSLRVVPHAGGLIAIVIVLLISYYRIQDIYADQQSANSVNRDVGLWLSSRTPEHAVVAVKDIGFIGYYSQRRILDLAGLVSPQSIPYRARADFLGPILAFHPNYFAFSEGQLRHLDIHGRGVLALYRQAREIRVGNSAYVIFELR